MKRSDRLKRVAEHFAGDRDLASRKLVELRSAMDGAEQRLEELRAYLDAYHAELDQIRRAGTSSAKLQNYTAFLSQLRAALEQQERHAEQARDAFEQQMAVWYQARSQVRAVEQAAERTVAVERKVQDRVEQRELDELARYRFLEKQG
ncbi:MAG: flagellar export protein FliJ [Pseudohaliea sp.]